MGLTFENKIYFQTISRVPVRLPAHAGGGRSEGRSDPLHSEISGPGEW